MEQHDSQQTQINFKDDHNNPSQSAFICQGNVCLKGSMGLTIIPLGYSAFHNPPNILSHVLWGL